MSSNFNGEEFKNSFCAPPPAAPDPPRYQAADSLHSNANIPPPPMYFPPKVHSNSDKSHETLMNHSAHAPKATSEQLLANVLATINEQRQKQPMVQIAKDPCYCEKVNSAILRSFAYIERKDRIAAGLLNGTTSADVNTNSAAELDLAYKRKKFANLLSNKKTNGIGVSNYSNDTKCADALAVYVDGLPFDYGENDLKALFGVVGGIKKIKIYRNSLGVSKGDALVTYIKPTSAHMACVQLHHVCIEDNVRISVTMADFSKKNVGSNSSFDSTSNTVCIDNSRDFAKFEGQFNIPQICECIRNECDVYLHPGVLFLNIATIYIPDNCMSVDTNAVISLQYKEHLAHLQSELREKCKCFGEVTNAVVLDHTCIQIPEACREKSSFFPIAYYNELFRVNNTCCGVVTFKDCSSVSACISQWKSKYVASSPGSATVVQCGIEFAIPIDLSDVCGVVPTVSDECKIDKSIAVSKECEGIVGDFEIDDFLNSLL